MVQNKLFSKLRMFDQRCVNRAETVHGTLRFLYLSHLLYGMCVKIFIVNRHISKSYTTSKNTIDRQYTERGQLQCQLLLVVESMNLAKNRAMQIFFYPSLSSMQDFCIFHVFWSYSTGFLLQLLGLTIKVPFFELQYFRPF